MKFVATVCLCAGALSAVGCTDGPAGPTSPSATGAVSDFAATAPGVNGTVAASSSAAPRHGALHVTKECSKFLTDSFCTLTSSDLKAIEVGTRILYLQPEQVGTPSGSEVVLDLPGPGNNKAFGNCSLAVGVCTFSGGTGKFTWFQARVDVSFNPDDGLWYWEGTYSFSPQH
jgi:hypothetical protein